MLLRAVALCALLSVAAAAEVSTGPVVCAGTLESEQTSINSVQKLKNLQERLSGCQYIIGDVHLIRIDQRDFGPLDPPFNFTFLNSIREVTGCVKVVDLCFSSALELPNLQVIRGTGCGNASLVLQFDSTCPLKAPHVAFPNLRLIGAGVTLFGVTSCYIERHINFNELFANPAMQSVIVHGNCSQLEDRCHENCTIWPEDMRSHCWGPEQRHCQPRSHCRQHSQANCSHQLCFADSKGGERCCSDQCLGGCYGPSASQCYGCRKFDRDGTCVPSCEPGHYYDPGSAQMVKSDTKRMVPYGPVCVTECPESYFIEDGSCVRKCTPGRTPNEDKLCVLTETARVCEHDPKKSSIACDISNPLLDGLKNDSLLCTEYHGSLTITTNCLQPSTVVGSIPLTLEQLYIMFSRLKVFCGQLQVNLIGDRRITNLTFLARLERLDSQPGHSRSGDMIVMAPALQFLGLASLRYVEKHVLLYLPSQLVPDGSNISICTGFMPKEAAFKEKAIDHGKSDTSLSPVRMHTSLIKALNSTIYKSTCPHQPDSCDPQCEPRFGCWGPGPANCVRCRYVKAGSACADSCDSVPGWFDGTNSTSRGGTNANSERLCSPCHPLCSRCTGSGRSNCTACRKGAFRDGSSCVSECSLERQFGDTTSGICRPCPRVCVNIANGNATCTGNMTSVGPGGCQFCTRIMVVPHSSSDSTPVLKCVPTDSGCPQGYYAAVLERGSKQLSNFSHFLALQQKAGFPVSVCRKCAPHCLSCQGSDVVCTACRFYSVDTGTSGDAKCETRDSPRCRDGYYPDHVTRTCRLCNTTCSSCSGPGESDCLRCIASKYALLTDPDVANGNLTLTATLACVDTCPEERPHAVASQRGLLCSDSPHGFQGWRPVGADVPAVAPLTAILIGIAGLAVAFVGLALSVWCCLRRRRRPATSSDEGKEELAAMRCPGQLDGRMNLQFGLAL